MCYSWDAHAHTETFEKQTESYRPAVALLTARLHTHTHTHTHTHNTNSDETVIIYWREVITVNTSKYTVCVCVCGSPCSLHSLR